MREVEGFGWKACTSKAPARGPPAKGCAIEFISLKMEIKSLCKNQIANTSVNTSFIITNIKKWLTDLYGNRLLPNDLTNTFFETRVSIFEHQNAGD